MLFSTLVSSWGCRDPALQVFYSIKKVEYFSIMQLKTFKETKGFTAAQSASGTMTNLCSIHKTIGATTLTDVGFLCVQKTWTYDELFL